jgi:hypothetical protein
MKHVLAAQCGVRILLSGGRGTEYQEHERREQKHDLVR